MPLHHTRGNQAILQNEQPIPGCKECAILWYLLLDARNQFRMRPTEDRLQAVFENAQDDYLEHYEMHQQQEEAH